jgi:tyrosyl-tRNA synthetase
VKSAAEQWDILKRGIDDAVPAGELQKKLEKSVATGKPLRVKYGIDPTGIDVHLGHTVPLRKLRQFQDLGHQAVLIIGNYTALVGDPSGRDQTRARLTQEQVEINAIDYLKQVGRIIDLQKTEVHRNGDWFSKFTFLDVLTLTSRITMQRMLERDDFTKRVKSGSPIYLHECLYPLMQGHDSVAIRADVELGGSEQLFSLMVARELQKDDGQEPQVAMTLPILRGLDGNRRMGKSLGNYIGVAEAAYDQFAKAMSIPDNLMGEWFKLLTDLPETEIPALADPAQTHPREAKERLGKEIVAFYHGAGAADAAAAEWRKRFSERQDPTDIPEVNLAASLLVDGKLGASKLVAALGLAKSNNEARRLVEQGSLSIGPDKTKVSDPNQLIEIQNGLIVRVGSRRIIKILIEG